MVKLSPNCPFHQKEFFGKVDQHYFGLLYPIMLHNFKETIREYIMKKSLHNFYPTCHLPQKEIFLENWLILLMSTVASHHAKMFLKISRAVNSGILGQAKPILFQKENWLTLLLPTCKVTFVYVLWLKMPQNFNAILR